MTINYINILSSKYVTLSSAVLMLVHCLRRWVNINSAVQNQKTVASYFTNKQVLPLRLQSKINAGPLSTTLGQY